jgi:hypothetical protein
MWFNLVDEINQHLDVADMRVYPKFPDWPPGVRTAGGKALCH